MLQGTVGVNSNEALSQETTGEDSWVNINDAILLRVCCGGQLGSISLRPFPRRQLVCCGRRLDFLIEWQINMVVALRNEIISSTVVFDLSAGELPQQSNRIHPHKILHL